MARGLRTLAVLFVCALACGCVGVLPIPTAKHTPKGAGTRGEIEKRGLRFLKTDPPTRTAVLLNLGEPDQVWDDERYFLYRWITTRGRVVAWAIDAHGEDAGSAPMGKKRHDLVFEFDDDGNVLRHADIRKWASTRMDRPAADGPLELPVAQTRPRRDGRWARRLYLGDALEVRGGARSTDVLRIEPDALRRLHYQTKRDVAWFNGFFEVRLHYVGDDGKPATVKLTLRLEHLPPLIDYVARNYPRARITA